MGKKNGRKIFALILIMALAFTSLPNIGLWSFVEAADKDVKVEVSNWEDLRRVLSSSGGDITVVLTKDIEKDYTTNMVGDKVSHEDHMNNIAIKVNSKITFDLNGHKIDLFDETRNGYPYSKEKDKAVKEKGIFYILPKGSLRVIDSQGGGEIRHHSQLREIVSYAKNRGYHDIFIMRGGDLVIDSGKFITGRSSKTWCSVLEHNNPSIWFHYTGWAYNLSTGSIVHFDELSGKSKVFLNDGTYVSYGDANIRCGAEFAPTIIINGGDYKIIGGNWDRYYKYNYSNGNLWIYNDWNLKVNAGVFKAEEINERLYNSHYGWYVLWSDVRTGLKYNNINKKAEIKINGKEIAEPRPETGNLPETKGYIMISPGEATITTDPAADQNVFFVPKGAEGYKITAKAKPYFVDYGLGRKPIIEAFLHKKSTGVSLGGSTHNVDASSSGWTTYTWSAQEYDYKGALIGITKKDYDVIIQTDSAPKISIEVKENPVLSGEKVTVNAMVDKEKDQIEEYIWENITNGEKFNNKSSQISFNAPKEDGIYLIQVTGKHKSGFEIKDIFQLQVGGKGSKPRIVTNELIFRQGVKKTLYVENSGGPVTEENWSYEGKLPKGLNFSAFLGLPAFYGTPEETGNFPITLKYKALGSEGKKKIDIIVTAQPFITTEDLSDGVKGKEYPKTKIELSMKGDALWSVYSGSLPSGITLNTKTGEISGKPDGSGAYNFGIKAQVPGELEAARDYSIYIHAKPEFSSNNIEISSAYGKEQYFSNQLTDGTGIIEFWLSGGSKPNGVELTSKGHPLGADKISVSKNTPEGNYSFTINAKGYKGETTSATVKLKVTKAPVKASESYLVDLPYGTLNKEYDSKDALRDSIFTEKTGTWKAADELPKGLSLDKNTGRITGRPTETTGKDSDGYPQLKPIKFDFTDKDGLSVRITTGLLIAEENDFKGLKSLSFDGFGKNVTTKTLYTGVINWFTIYEDGTPPSEFEVEGNPEWLKVFKLFGSDNKSIRNISLDASFLSETGRFPFTIRAKNDFNKDWVTQDFVINVEEAPKASPPKVDKPSGTYSKSSLKSIILTSEEKGGVIIQYSINGGEFQDYYLPKDEKFYLFINEDTVIECYTDTGFGIGGVKKANSDLVKYEYIIAEDGSPIITIENDELPDGKANESYKSVELKGTSSDGQDIVWYASGLPDGMALSNNKISGTPTLGGDFTVKLIANSKDGKIASTKIVALKIIDASQAMATEPTVSENFKDAAYKLGDSAKPMSVSAKGDGKLSYQWYQSEDSKTDTPADDVLVFSENDKDKSSFVPPTDSVGSKYYYVVVSNNKDNNQPGKKVSDIVKVEVKGDASTPYFYDTDTREYLFPQKSEQLIMEIAIIEDEGELSYEWYQMTGDKPNPAKDKKVPLTKEDVDGFLAIKAPKLGQTDKYYVLIKNTNDKVSGNKTSGTVTSPIHIVKSTDGTIYSINFEPENSEEKFVMETGYDGKIKDLPELVKANHVFKGWFTEKSGGEKVTSDTVLTKDMVLYARWEESEDIVLPFADVKESDWFYENVAYVFKNGLMNGTSDTTFGPRGTTTRGMIVTILYRIEGEPKAGANPFTDVEKGKYYTDPVAWAEEQKIVSGYGSGKFGPNDPITREQMAVILMNYAKAKGYKTSERGDLNKFDDNKDVSSWANEALSWANGLGLIKGTGTKVDPKSNAERSQVAAIIERFIEGNK